MFNNHSVAKQPGGFHVAELAQKAGVTPATIRYYSRVGLLDPDREESNGYRCFSAADLHRVAFVRQAQALGLTIGDIRFIFETLANGEVPCVQVKLLVEQRLKSIKTQIADLRATETRIRRALDYWEQMTDPAPEDGEICPLIERLETEGPFADNVSNLPARKHMPNQAVRCPKAICAAQGARN